MNLQILLQQIVADVATSPEVQAVPEKMMKIIQACHLQDDLKII